MHLDEKLNWKIMGDYEYMSGSYLLHLTTEQENIPKKIILRYLNSLGRNKTQISGYMVILNYDTEYNSM